MIALLRRGSVQFIHFFRAEGIGFRSVSLQPDPTHRRRRFLDFFGCLALGLDPGPSKEEVLDELVKSYVGKAAYRSNSGILIVTPLRGQGNDALRSTMGDAGRGG
jgi:hypothetical protein